MQDIEHIKNKIDSKVSYNKDTIEMLKRDMYAPSAFINNHEFQSPRVKNLNYKPIICYVFYVLTYLKLKPQVDELKPQRTPSPLPKHTNISFKPLKSIATKPNK